jgi:hypothetical protein
VDRNANDKTMASTKPKSNNTSRRVLGVCQCGFK